MRSLRTSLYLVGLVMTILSKDFVIECGTIFHNSMKKVDESPPSTIATSSLTASETSSTSSETSPTISTTSETSSTTSTTETSSATSMTPSTMSTTSKTSETSSTTPTISSTASETSSSTQTISSTISETSSTTLMTSSTSETSSSILTTSSTTSETSSTTPTISSTTSEASSSIPTISSTSLATTTTSSTASTTLTTSATASTTTPISATATLPTTSEAATTSPPVAMTTSATTTSAAATSSTLATTSVILASTTVSPFEPHEPDFTGIFVNFNFTISLNGSWDDSFGDSNSEGYKKLAADVRTSLDIVYYNSYAPGYSDIVIKKFTDGSIIANYEAVFEGEEAFTNYDAIKVALNDIYQNLLIVPSIGGYSVNGDYLEHNMPAQINETQQTVEESRLNICSTSSDVCYPYEQCVYNTSYTSGIICFPGCYQLCFAEHQECLYEDGTTAVCRCVEGYVLEGGECSESGNSAAVISLSVILVLLAASFAVFVVVELRFRKHKSGKQKDDCRLQTIDNALYGVSCRSEQTATNNENLNDSRQYMSLNAAFQEEYTKLNNVNNRQESTKQGISSQRKSSSLSSVSQLSDISVKNADVEYGNIRTSNADNYLLYKEFPEQQRNSITIDTCRL